MKIENRLQGHGSRNFSTQRISFIDSHTRADIESEVLRKLFKRKTISSSAISEEEHSIQIQPETA